MVNSGLNKIVYNIIVIKKRVLFWFLVDLVFSFDFYE